MAKIQIKILLADSSSCCSLCKSIAAVVTNLDTGQAFTCHFRAPDNAFMLDTKHSILNENSYLRTKAYKKHADSDWTEEDEKQYINRRIVSQLINSVGGVGSIYSIIKLNAEGDFDRFVAEFRARYDQDTNTYRCFTNNCSSAVNFVLNYFFPDQPKLNFVHNGFRLLFSPVSLCGVISSLPCPAPPCIDSPGDAYRKALLFSYFAKSPTEIKSAPPAQKMDDEKVERKINPYVKQ